jgi:acyl-CoA thioester hydrolase
MSPRAKIKYFRENTDDPKPLVTEVMRRVRFEEVDPLTIVWHGRYPSYLEDGRASFGEKYGLGYMDMYKQKFMAPVAQMHIDYLEPLSFPEEFKIITMLHWADSAKLNFSYRIENEDGNTCARGYTIQVITNLSREVMLLRPKYLDDFFIAWKDGKLK